MMVIYASCFKAQILSTRQPSFSLFYYAITQWILFSNNNINSRYLFVMINMYCDDSIIIMWSLNFFISAFPLTCLLLKSFVKQSESDLHIV